MTTATASIDHLIAKVAVRHIEDALAEAPEGRLLYAIVGFDRQLTSTLARAFAEATFKDDLLLGVHRHRADDDLPTALVTDETSIYFRSNASKRLVIFAPDEDERSGVGASLGNVHRIDARTLYAAPAIWLTAADVVVDDTAREYLERALAGLLATDIVLHPRMLAAFVLALAAELDPRPADEALKRAIAELRLPAMSVRFPKPPKAGAKPKPAKKFRDLFLAAAKETADPLHLRNDKGQPLERERLRERVAELLAEDKLERPEADTVRALIDDDTIRPGAWNPATQGAVCRLDWSRIAPVFAASKPKRKEPLAKATLTFFDNEYPEALTTGERQVLDGMTGAETAEPSEEEREFFFARREHLRDRRAGDLHKRWEKKIYGAKKEFDDLLVALLHGFEQLIASAPGGDAPMRQPHVYIRLRRGEKLSFWQQDLNTAVYAWFFTRFRGLETLLGDVATLNVGRAFDHDLKTQAVSADAVSATGRDATTLEFDLHLIERDDLDTGDELEARLRAAPKATVVLRMPAAAVATNLDADLHEISQHGTAYERALLVRAPFAQQPSSGRGRRTAVDLKNAATLRDATGDSQGSLVNTKRESDLVCAVFQNALAGLHADGVVDTAAHAAIATAFERFHLTYGAALHALVAEDGAGIAADALLEQAHAYGELLETVRHHATADRARLELWRPLAEIGIAFDQSGEGAIVAPWQPLRLAELRIKAEHLAGIGRELLTALGRGEEITDVFFDTAARRLAEPYYPGVCLARHDQGPMVLATAASFADYSLMEPPEIDPDTHQEIVDVNAGDAAREFIKIAEDYLELQPHEQANFSMVLYDAESRELPNALSNRLARKIERNPALRCDLMMTHHRADRLRRIYAEQNAAAGSEAAAALANETSRNFLSRLRVGFIDAAAHGGDGDDDTRVADLVLLQNVLGRLARVEWVAAPSAATAVDLAAFDPTARSRRRPYRPGDTATTSYVTAPLLPRPVQQFVDLLYASCHPHNPGCGEHYLPVRKLTFGEGRVKRILDEAHRIGDWVVNYDTIADRRLMQDSNIRVIRHLSKPAGGASLIVSSSDPGKSLRHKLDRELDRIAPGLDDARRHVLIDNCLEEAIALSGRIIMQAALFERHTLEMIGLVLTKRLIEESLPTATVAWFFLDDVGAWFGQKDGHIADLLAAVPLVDGDGPRLRLVIAESKCIGEASWGEDAQKSRRQLEQTFRALHRAYIGEPAPIDRDIWRARLADMLLEQMTMTGELGGLDLFGWAEGLRAGRIPIELGGESMVFVHDRTTDAGIAEAAMEQDGLRQLVLDRAVMNQLLRRLAPATDDTPNKPVALADAARFARPGPDTAAVDTAKVDTATATPRAAPTPADGITTAPPGTAEPAAPTPPCDRRPAPGDSGADSTDAGEAGAASAPTATDDIAAGRRDDTGDTSTPGERPTDIGTGGLPPPLHDHLDRQGHELDDEAGLAWLAETWRRLKRAMTGYGMTAECVERRLTPNGALIRLKGSNSLTIPMIEKKREEFLTSHAIEIVSIRPAPGEILVMVKREDRRILPLGATMLARELPATAPLANDHLLLGAKEDDGELMYLNLDGEFGGFAEHGPHTLIAGTTGSGKGVLVQLLLLDLLATNSPEAARIRLIDPKHAADYAWIRGAPHLDGDVVTDQDGAIATLKDTVAVMEERYQRIVDAGCAKISEYNAICAPHERLPRLFVFHDELADWIEDKDNPEYRAAIESYVVRLVSKARAAGIHLVLITQRPDREALPPKIKANMNNKLCLRVESRVNSQIVLDEPGAELLLGKGHLAAKLGNDRPSSACSYFLAQVPFAPNAEIKEMAERLIAFWQARRRAAA